MYTCKSNQKLSGFFYGTCLKSDTLLWKVEEFSDKSSKESKKVITIKNQHSLTSMGANEDHIGT